MGFESLELRRVLTTEMVGVAPGIHLVAEGLGASPTDDSWQFELLRADDIDVRINFQHTLGNLDLEVLDADGNSLGTSTGTSDQELITLTGLTPGTYVARVNSVDPTDNLYDLSILPSATSSTTVHYVNDSQTTDDLYALAPGNDANDGLSPLFPKATVQSVLAGNLGPNDLVKIDTGTYVDTVLIDKTDEGAAYAGSPAGSVFTAGTTRWELVDADFNVLYGLTFGGSTGGTAIHARGNGVDASTNNTFRDNQFTATFTAIRIDDGQDDVIRNNTITGASSQGIHLDGGNDISILENTLSGASVAISSTANGPLIQSNALAAIDTVIQIGAGNAAEISGNDIADATTGVSVNFTANDTRIVGNTVSGSEIGIQVTAAGTEIQGNDIHNNQTGVDADNGILITSNRVHHNLVGIVAEDDVDLRNNVIYRNSTSGVVVDFGDTVRLINNTIYTDTGDGVRLQNDSEYITLRNNIIWTEEGYNFRVDNDSQTGFDSDYNNLFTSASGKIALWNAKEFTDLFDWQVEADFDANSIGFTSLNPNLDNPQFVDLIGDDYRLTDAVSTSIDAGDPAATFDQEPTANGGRINLGAFGNTSAAASSRTRYIEVGAPNFYGDLQAAVGQVVLWQTFDESEPSQQLAGNVDIDLLEEGVGKVADIAIVPAADNSVSWTPAALGISGDIGKRYRIRIESLNDPGLFDQSREVFSIVPDGDQFYVDDPSNDSDQYTPTAIGNNRNTGQSPTDPKAVLLALVRSYDLGPDDTVRIDTGDYVHVRNTIISGAPGIGDDEGATFTGPDDGDPSKVARIDRANSETGSTNIQLEQATSVTLQHLTLVGAEQGLTVQNGSTRFTGRQLVVAGNAGDGLQIASDAELSSLDQITAFNNGGDGIDVATAIVSLNDSLAYNNGNSGIRLSNQDGVVLQNNESYGNRVGISLTAISSGQNQNILGNADLSAGSGNRVYNNDDTGVSASGNVLVVGNTVYGHAGIGDAGIVVSSNAEATRNVVYGNYNGIQLGTGNSSGRSTRNRVYNNSNIGILAQQDSDVRENTVYSNFVGIQGDRISNGTFRGLIENNLVYANSTQGIVVDDAVVSGDFGVRILNNTVYQEVGDAVRIQNTAEGVQLSNNILWVDQGFAISVSTDSQVGFTSDFNLLFTTGTGQIGFWQDLARPSLSSWRNASFADENSFDQNPIFVDPSGGDGQFGFVDATNDGRDDDFHLQSAAGRFSGSLTPVLDTHTGLPTLLPSNEVNDAAQSPAIDRGAPESPFDNEPAENGNFINLGAYGNTEQASKSPEEYILVTRPDGGDIWPAEQTFSVRWRSESLVDSTHVTPGHAADYAAGVLADNPSGFWKLNETSATAFDTSGNNNDGTYQNGVTQGVAGFLLGDDAAEFDGVDDVVVIPHDASLTPGAITVEGWIQPDAGISLYDGVLMKSSSGSWTDGYGMFYENGDLVFFVNNWSSVRVQAPLTLDAWQHVAATYSQADGELRLYINGTQVDSRSYSSPINHSGSAALQLGQSTGSTSYTWTGGLDEIAVYPLALTDQAVSQHFLLGTNADASAVDVELVRDSDPGYSYLIADDALNDGSLDWTIPDDAGQIPPAADYRVRVTRTDNVLLTDESSNVFSITAPITTYYVDDNSNTNDQYTPGATGDDANDGLSPATPKASIRAVLEAYDLGPGDTVLVDHGSYTLSTNIVIDAADAGVTIQGPAAAGSAAVLDRANTTSGSYVVELIDADGVTLDGLSLTGGEYGVYAANDSDSDDVTITNSRVFDNDRNGILIFSGNDRLTLSGNTVFDHRSSSSTGIFVTGSSAVMLQGNTVYSNGTGIYVDVSFGSLDEATISNNRVFDNLNAGIVADGPVLVSGNTVFGHDGSSSTAILLDDGARATQNTVYANTNGIRVGGRFGGALATGNRVYDNSNIGILAQEDSLVRGNTVYSNSVGIQADVVTTSTSNFYGRIENNLVYANSNQGIVIDDSAAFSGQRAEVINNTVYQEVGDAIRVQGTAEEVELKNNILWIEEGYALFVTADSQIGFESDYNLFHTTNPTAGRLANWSGSDFFIDPGQVPNRVDWFYELGLDGNSRTGDPQLVDRDGPDGLLGFSTAAIGGPLILDDGDPGVTLSGTWTQTTGNGGLNDDYWEASSGTGDNVARWNFSGLAAGTYQVAATWRANSGNAFSVPYRIFDDGEFVSSQFVNHRVAPDDFSDVGVDWERLGTVVITGSTLEVRLDDQATGRVIADGVRIQRIEGDRGADDDFQLQVNSPAIDAGDPLSYYLAEPTPNGDRANIGAVRKHGPGDAQRRPVGSGTQPQRI